MTNDDVEKLGPLGPLAGVWEGGKGTDTAPDDDRGTEINKYRERLVLEPIATVENHEQKLQGLRYATTAWRLGEDDPFHEELGYWLWDAEARQVLRCFMVPRGVSVIAGGTVEPDARSFALSAEVGSETYGICSNRFLDEEFKTVRYELTVTIHDRDSFSYREDTQLRIKGQADLFHHTDENTLRLVG
jgi:hypothetical protein